MRVREGDVITDVEARVMWGHKPRNVSFQKLEKTTFSPRASRGNTALLTHFRLLILEP